MPKGSARKIKPQHHLAIGCQQGDLTKIKPSTFFLLSSDTLSFSLDGLAAPSAVPLAPPR